jgi:hypothetical protein
MLQIFTHKVTNINAVICSRKLKHQNKVTTLGAWALIQNVNALHFAKSLRVGSACL